jgi:hypothetical protein
MNEFDAWGVPAIKSLISEHPDYTITRSQLAEILTASFDELAQDGRRIPKWIAGNLLADVANRTHAMYHQSRPRSNVCFHCMGSGEKTEEARK